MRWLVFLAAWALVAPPMTPDGTAVKTEAPIAQWTQLSQFDTEEICRSVLSGIKANPDPRPEVWEKMPDKELAGKIRAGMVARIKASRCVPEGSARRPTPDVR